MPRSPLDAVIDQLNRHRAERLAVDLPSGLDCDTGEPAGYTFRAEVTCTFVAVKPELAVPSSADYVGRFHLVDVGVPRKPVDTSNGLPDTRSPAGPKDGHVDIQETEKA